MAENKPTQAMRKALEGWHSNITTEGLELLEEAGLVFVIRNYLGIGDFAQLTEAGHKALGDGDAKEAGAL